MKDLLRHRSFLGRNFYTKQHLHSQHIERKLFPMSSHSFGRLGASLCCRLPLWCLEALLKIFLEEKLLISSLLRWIFWNNTTKIALRFLCYLKAQVLHDLAVSKFRHVTSKTQNTFYVTGCTTERVWGGGGGLLIITFSSWPRLLVLKMCIVRLYLKTCSNHQTVFIFTFVSTRLSDNSTGAFNRKLTCWGIKLVNLKRPDLNFVIHRNNTTEKVFVGTIFIFPVHDTIFLSHPREGHAVSLNTPKSPTPKKSRYRKFQTPQNPSITPVTCNL